jgi:hypothetical protein
MGPAKSVAATIAFRVHKWASSISASSAALKLVKPNEKVAVWKQANNDRLWFLSAVFLAH